MKFLIIDKEQRIGKNQNLTYATSRIIQELEIKKIEYDFLLFGNIEILFKNSNTEIFGNGRCLSEYSHILFRGHSLDNNREYETKRLITDYIEQTNLNKENKPTYLQNSEAILNLPYYNKIWFAHICSKNNLPHLQTYYRMDGEYAMKHKFSDNYPVIIKEYTGENDIRIIEGEEKIKKNVYKINKLDDYKQEHLAEKNMKNYFLQEYSDSGEDMRIFVSKGRVIGGWKRKATKNFLTVSKGEYTMYNNPSPEIIKLAEKTARAFRADFIATDFMFKDGKPYLLEISFNPGFKAYEEKAKGDKPVNIAKYIIESFQED